MKCRGICLKKMLLRLYGVLGKIKFFFFVEIIEDLNGNSFFYVFNILNKILFGYILKELKKFYEKYLFI